MSLFGPLLPALTVEKAVHLQLQQRLPTYLAEVAAQAGLTRAFLARPAAYATASQFGRLGDQLPCVGIHVPGIVGRPVKDGRSGAMTVKWRLEVGALVAAIDHVATDQLAKLYGAALWGAIMQHPSLGGAAQNIEWPDGGETYDTIEKSGTNGRQLAFALLRFDVLAVDVRGTYGGPKTFVEPDTTVYGVWPPVLNVDVDVQPFGTVTSVLGTELGEELITQSGDLITVEV